MGPRSTWSPPLVALTLLTSIRTASRPALETLLATSNKTMCPHDSSLAQGQRKQRGSSCPPGHSRVQVCRNWVEPMGGRSECWEDTGSGRQRSQGGREDISTGQQGKAKEWGEGRGSLRSEVRERGGVKSWSSAGVQGAGRCSPGL